MCKCPPFKGTPTSNCKIREVGDDASFLLLNFYVLLALSSQLLVSLKLCIMNTVLHFLSCQSYRSLRNVSLHGPRIPEMNGIRFLKSKSNLTISFQNPIQIL